MRFRGCGLSIILAVVALGSILTSCGDDESVRGGGGSSAGGAAGSVIPIDEDTGVGTWQPPEGLT